MDSECAFAKLRFRLATAPVLDYPDPKLAFILDTQASNMGLGAVLSQSGEQGGRVVAYFSCALCPAEQN